jgi:hypothetical protein
LRLHQRVRSSDLVLGGVAFVAVHCHSVIRWNSAPAYDHEPTATRTATTLPSNPAADLVSAAFLSAVRVLAVGGRSMSGQTAEELTSVEAVADVVLHQLTEGIQRALGPGC